MADFEHEIPDILRSQNAKLLQWTIMSSLALTKNREVWRVLDSLPRYNECENIERSSS
jgi:hypothetical protein